MSARILLAVLGEGESQGGGPLTGLGVTRERAEQWLGAELLRITAKRRAAAHHRRAPSRWLTCRPGRYLAARMACGRRRVGEHRRLPARVWTGGASGRCRLVRLVGATSLEPGLLNTSLVLLVLLVPLIPFTPCAPFAGWIWPSRRIRAVMVAKILLVSRIFRDLFRIPECGWRLLRIRATMPDQSRRGSCYRCLRADISFI